MANISNSKFSLSGIFLFCLMIVAVVLIVAWVFKDTKMAHTFSGAMSTTIESEEYAVPASGSNLRVYSFTDSHGRHCTGVYSNESGAWGDCDYPPNWTPQ
jgi:hypothetical protein